MLVDNIINSISLLFAWAKLGGVLFVYAQEIYWLIYEVIFVRLLSIWLVCMILHKVVLILLFAHLDRIHLLSTNSIIPLWHLILTFVRIVFLFPVNVRLLGSFNNVPFWLIIFLCIIVIYKAFLVQEIRMTSRLFVLGAFEICRTLNLFGVFAAYGESVDLF